MGVCLRKQFRLFPPNHRPLGSPAADAKKQPTKPTTSGHPLQRFPLFAEQRLYSKNTGFIIDKYRRLVN